MSSPRDDSIRLPQTTESFDFPMSADSAENISLIETNEILDTIKNHVKDVTLDANTGFYMGLIKIDSGLPSGNGLVVYPDGNILLGHFNNNTRNGTECKAIMKEGGTIHGDLHHGKFSGIGEMKMKQGLVRYEGSFHMNMLHGSGKFSTDNYEYSGEFEQGKRSGLGEVRISNKKYVGQFREDQPHGPGRLATDQANGKIEVLQGNFVKGVPIGEGKLIDSQGSQWFVFYDAGQCVEKIPMHEKQIRDLKNEVESLNSRLEDRGPQERCSICQAQAVDTVVPTCGHVAMCQACESRLMPKRCPICRRNYREAIKLIYS